MRAPGAPPGLAANYSPPFRVYTDVTGEAAMAITDQGTEVVSDRLDALFDTHHRRLSQLARRLSGTADDARDLVQETFLRALQARQSIPVGSSSEEAWLVRVLVNVCRDRWRRRRATKRQVDAHGALMHAVEQGNPESAVVARSVVWCALGTLPPRRRAVLVMHELEGADIAAIARTLGVSAVTIRWHLSRGRRQLAQAIRAQEQRP